MMQYAKLTDTGDEETLLHKLVQLIHILIGFSKTKLMDLRLSREQMEQFLGMNITLTITCTNSMFIRLSEPLWHCCRVCTVIEET